MAEKQNNRLLLALIAAVAVLIAAACLLFFSDCGGDDDWIAQDGSQSSQNALFDGVYAVPQFRSGRYTMISTVLNTEDYTDANGQSIYTYSTSTRYTYLLDIDVSDSAVTCRYTFGSIYGTTTDNGTVTVGLNTDDPNARTDELSAFYSLIGKSFTVTAMPDGTFVSIDGLDEITAAVPETAALLDRDTMISMAADLFYPLSGTVTGGSTWQTTSYGLINTYTVKRMNNGFFGVDITGSESELPDSFTDDSGFTTSYSSAQPLTGTLLMSCADRAVQELSTNQRYAGTVADSENRGYYFTITAQTTCSIAAAEGDAQ